MGRKLLVGAIGLFSAAILIGCAASSQPSVEAGIPDRPEQLSKSEVSFLPRKPERWVLANGLVVYYIFDDELPVMKGKLMFPGGSLYESGEQAGLFEALGEQLREGSIKGMTPEVLDKTLDDTAASIESGYGADSGAVSFSCLEEDFDKVFGLASRVVREPAFDPKRLAIWKSLAAQAIKRRRDDPETMAGIAFVQGVYGKDSPFGRLPRESSLARITPAMMRDAHRRFIRPNGSFLVVTGALPKDRVAAAIEREFGSWARAADPLPPLPTVDTTVRPGIYVLERDFDQASVVMGHLGPPRLPPDIHQMSIYNRILGTGGFGSLLFNEIRSKLGLAYDVGGGLAPGVVLGTFEITLGTKATEVGKAIKRVAEIIEQTTHELPPQENFDSAKSSVERSFIFRFDSSFAVAQRAAQLEMTNFPADYDSTYLAKIAEVSRENVEQVGQRWIRPKDYVIVIVGKVDTAALKEQLAPLGLPFYRLDFGAEPEVKGPLFQ